MKSIKLWEVNSDWCWNHFWFGLYILHPLKYNAVLETSAGKIFYLHDQASLDLIYQHTLTVFLVL